jgi:hypothetical protein
MNGVNGNKSYTSFAGIPYVCFMVKIPVLPEESALDIHTVMIILERRVQGVK